MYLRTTWGHLCTALCLFPVDLLSELAAKDCSLRLNVHPGVWEGPS
jgi:hypothetical protein